MGSAGSATTFVDWGRLRGRAFSKQGDVISNSRAFIKRVLVEAPQRTWRVLVVVWQGLGACGGG
jgi:hypothetical protein